MESHVPPSPSKVHGPTGSNSSAAAAPAGALWPDAYSQNAYKVPPTTPPPTLQAGGNSGIVDAREYHKKWQDRPYDPNDDPWIEDDVKDPKNDKPVIQLFGNVVQKNAEIAEAKAAAAAIAEIANRFCADADGQSAGLHGSKIHIIGHARFSRWGRFAEKHITYHDFVVRVFNQSMEECRYAKKMIGQFRKKLTPTPRTQGPDFCAFLNHCRVDAFLNAGYVYQREFSWR